MININKAKDIINKIEKKEKISRKDAFTLLSSFEYDNNINIKNVFMRGLIEFTNYCKNDCIYCGIRKSNKNAERYRLCKEDILSCCELGYEIGFRTFVLQGGEDTYYNINIMSDIVDAIKTKFPDSALTLSIGEKEKEYYKVLNKRKRS